MYNCLKTPIRNHFGMITNEHCIAIKITAIYMFQISTYGDFNSSTTLVSGDEILNSRSSQQCRNGLLGTSCRTHLKQMHLVDGRLQNEDLLGSATGNFLETSNGLFVLKTQYHAKFGVSKCQTR